MSILPASRPRSVSKKLPYFKRFDEVRVALFLNLLALCQHCLDLTKQSHQNQLPRYRNAGCKPLYSDATIMATSIIQRLWLLPQEEVLNRINDNDALAEALGYSGQVISQSHYSRRLQAMSLLPYFCFFVLSVFKLIEMGVITCKFLVMDATIVKAFSKLDLNAWWSHPKKWKKSTFGYKIHLLICYDSGLPVMMMCSSANFYDSPFAAPMLIMVKLLFGPFIRVCCFYADSAYDTKLIHFLVEKLFGAVAIIDYNLRRKGKKFLATIAFIKNWKRKYKRRSKIERVFAWMKRSFRLNEFTCFGAKNFVRFAFTTAIAQLVVAWIAAAHDRKDLINQRRNVLAHP